MEVCGKEEGFFGSYYEATIVSYLNNARYVVRYKTLVDDDEAKPLTETVNLRELRPSPPLVRSTSEFSLHQKVDAFHNDGWWVGEITGKSGSQYTVYFATSNEEIVYPSSQIRVHQDWVNGEWIS